MRFCDVSIELNLYYYHTTYEHGPLQTCTAEEPKSINKINSLIREEFSFPNAQIQIAINRINCHLLEIFDWVPLNLAHFVSLDVVKRVWLKYSRQLQLLHTHFSVKFRFKLRVAMRLKVITLKK